MFFGYSYGGSSKLLCVFLGFAVVKKMGFIEGSEKLGFQNRHFLETSDNVFLKTLQHYNKGVSRDLVVFVSMKTQRPPKKGYQLNIRVSEK